MDSLSYLRPFRRTYILILSLLIFACKSDDSNDDSEAVPISLIGSWLFDNPGTSERTVVTFIDPTHFMLVDDGIADADGQPGLERGTYAWNQNNGTLSTAITTDTNGDWGISGLSELTLSVSGNTINATADGETLIFNKILPSSSSALIGSWLFGGAGSTEMSVITFINSNNYVLGDDGIADDGGQPGIERGNYTWNSSDGAVSATASTDTNGDWGLVPVGAGFMTINNDILTYVSTVEGDTVTASRIE